MYIPFNNPWKKNIIHANSVIGSDGLGFAKKDNSWEKIEHLGIVKIEDNVEIGASCTIDRGSLGMTLIGKGVKLDRFTLLTIVNRKKYYYRS